MHYHALSRYPESDVVLVNQAGQEKVIVAKPNHSATWRHNLWPVSYTHLTLPTRAQV